MKKLFVDTGYWVALLKPDDELHKKAKNINQSLTSDIVLITSEMVFVELLAAFSGMGKQYRGRVVQLVQYAAQTPDIEIIPQTTTLFQSALQLYSQRLDKNWSLTDCSSFHIMRQQNISEVLAYDKHFEQAGFIALLRK